MSNERKTKYLGMSFSKASHQLHKQYLLKLLQRLGEDNCYRCGEKIETIRELSFEHKEPWLDVSVDLFWNLDNLTHSHLSCNSSVARRDAQGKVAIESGQLAQAREARTAHSYVKMWETRRDMV